MAANLKISPRRLIKPHTQPLWKLFLFLGEGQVREWPDLETPVTALGIMRRTARENKCWLKTVQRNSTETEVFLVWGHTAIFIWFLKPPTEPDPCYKCISQNPPLRNVGNTNGAAFLPQMAKWGKHITLILIFWLFDNRQPLVLFPQPSHRPYLHLAGLTDFSPERMHYSQVINCLKLFLNENAGNLRCSFLNGGRAGQFPNCLYRRFFPAIDSFFISYITNLQSSLSEPRTAPIHAALVFMRQMSCFSPPPVLVPCYLFSQPSPPPLLPLPPAYSWTILPRKAPTAPVTTT